MVSFQLFFRLMLFFLFFRLWINYVPVFAFWGCRFETFDTLGDIFSDVL